jgi:basic amino acid/polyamine antiporter, APA family
MLSPWAGFLAGWLFLAAKAASAAATALGFGSYLSAVLPVPPVALDLFRLKNAGRINLVLVAVTLASLLAFVAAGWSGIRPENFRDFGAKGIPGILSAASLEKVTNLRRGNVT